MPDHQVQQGDCLASIAQSYGFDCDFLWGLAQNAKLRAKRKNPNILLPGDVVFVPDKQMRQEDRAVNQHHTFVRSSQPVKLKIRLLAAGKPVANEAYDLAIGGKNLHGNTDASGILEETIPASATDATLTLGKEHLELPLKIGYLDPATEISGVQARLNNLGFHCGQVDGIAGPLTRSALLAFQETYQLEQTGRIDATTCEKLRSQHGC